MKTRGLYQCSACLPGADLAALGPIAGTIFASTKLELRVWCRALYHLTQTKQGISSIELGRRLGVTQATAWLLKPFGACPFGVEGALLSLGRFANLAAQRASNR